MKIWIKYWLGAAASLALFASFGQAQTLNGTPLLLSRTQSNNNWLVDITKYFNFMGGAAPHLPPAAYGTGVNPCQTPAYGIKG